MKEKTNIKAEIVADSIDPRGNRLTSVLVVMPRIIIAEMNTHRMLSKNTSSSRAIPFKKMVEAVEDDPFIPIAFQKHHSGMQGTEYLTEVESRVAESNWLQARDRAVMMARHMYDGGVTKQLCNRLLEPFMWTTMLITGSEESWSNFFELRCPQYELGIKNQSIYFKSKKDYQEYFQLNSFSYKIPDEYWKILNKGQAEIHIMDLAEKIYDATNESNPKQLKPGEWHIPYQDIIEPEVRNFYSNVPDHEFRESDIIQTMVEVSTSMAARESYTVVGNSKEVSVKEHIDLYKKLVSYDPPHSSPMEHCWVAMNNAEYYSFIRGELPELRVQNDSIHDRKTLRNSYGYQQHLPENRDTLPTIQGKLINEKFYADKDLPNVFGWCRNGRGFIPLRHKIETNSF